MGTEITLPETLYHYTTAQGLLGVIGRANQPNQLGDETDNALSIWASQIDCLNDYMELRQLLDVLIETINDRYHNDFPEDAHLFARVASAVIAENGRRFVASFSTERDDLAQWRAYSPQGHGYCIGFRTESVMRSAVQACFSLQKCQYLEKSELTEIVEDLYQNLYTTLTRPDGTIIVKEFGDWAGRSFDKAATIKNPAFNHENEYRLINTKEVPSPTIRYREGNGRIIPYVQILLESEAITEIVVGPGPHSDLNLQSIEMLCTARSLEHISFSISGAPYRYW